LSASVLKKEGIRPQMLVGRGWGSELTSWRSATIRSEWEQGKKKRIGGKLCEGGGGGSHRSETREERGGEGTLTRNMLMKLLKGLSQRLRLRDSFFDQGPVL